MKTKHFIMERKIWCPDCQHFTFQLIELCGAENNKIIFRSLCLSCFDERTKYNKSTCYHNNKVATNDWNSLVTAEIF